MYIPAIFLDDVSYCRTNLPAILHTYINAPLAVGVIALISKYIVFTDVHSFILYESASMVHGISFKVLLHK